MCGRTSSASLAVSPARQTALDEAAAARRALANKQDAVIATLGEQVVSARKNKKGAVVVTAFDVLQDLVIQRQSGDTEDVLDTIDKYVAAFKV